MEGCRGRFSYLKRQEPDLINPPPTKTTPPSVSFHLILSGFPCLSSTMRRGVAHAMQPSNVAHATQRYSYPAMPTTDPACALLPLFVQVSHATCGTKAHHGHVQDMGAAGAHGTDTNATHDEERASPTLRPAFPICGVVHSSKVPYDSNSESVCLLQAGQPSQP